MAQLTKNPGPEVATKADLEKAETALRGEIQAVETALRGEIQAAETALRGEVQAVETTLRGEIHAVEDRLTRKITAVEVNLREDLKNYVTKEEFQAFRDEMLTRFDQMLVILMRLDQERVFTLERIRRIEEDLARVKAVLNLE